MECLSWKRIQNKVEIERNWKNEFGKGHFVLKEKEKGKQHYVSITNRLLRFSWLD